MPFAERPTSIYLTLTAVILAAVRGLLLLIIKKSANT
jgi:hypothetical protein